uniref:VWFA domain-containing protein n=1 Tax=Cyclophora tenuis TaxID=216820 RepID=A0A7S1GJZ3_CYCTE|mmetsp:Transcript_21689/g.36931  ORF Transcript_21689/g.36931 Transcript_21689/m.36931 type:complete len:390 (+) Transcript_21689:3-1172(+)
MTSYNTPFATAVPVVPLTVDAHLKNQRTNTPLSPDIDAPGIDDYQINVLMDQGFTRGLAQSLAANNEVFQYRIWVVDNSGSMNQPDGHRIVDTIDNTTVKIVEATRWEEIRECVNYHVKAARLLNAPTTFRLLNDPGRLVGPQQFGVAETPDQDEHEVMRIMQKVHPTGSTPLTSHIKEIHRAVSDMTSQLRATGRKVVIVIATDGLPTDEFGVSGAYQQKQFVDCLRLLEGLPVWVVVRLCTDEDEVVNFYNDLDEQLELSLEVLDDFCGEAAEVYEFNSWLNYALPLHRCREMGYHHRVFDMIDERTLTKSELREFCELLFGVDKFDGVPDPAVDWMGFSARIEAMLRQEKPQWNPMKKIVTPWIDMRKLDRIYGGAGGCAPGCTIM